MLEQIWYQRNRIIFNNGRLDSNFNMITINLKFEEFKKVLIDDKNFGAAMKEDILVYVSTKWQPHQN